MSIKPTLNIHQPRWIAPALLQKGQDLTVIVSGDLDDSVHIALQAVGQNNRMWNLPIVDRQKLHQGEKTAMQWVCATGDVDGEGLFDLIVTCGNKPEAMAQRAVHIACEIPQNFDVVHITDTHFLRSDAQKKSLIDQSEVLGDLIERINAIKPAFVVHTGDLISRYGLTTKDRLSNAHILWQYEQAESILKKLKVPLFMTPGNHDLAFETSRACWRRTMGQKWNDGPDDFYWDYGACRFVCVDNSVRFDETGHQPATMNLDDPRGSWLEQTCVNRPKNSGCVLISHSDSDQVLNGYFKRCRINLALCGHSKTSPWVNCDMTRTIDGHLSHKPLWRMWRFAPEKITANDAVDHENNPQ
jgi:calcineurin-like phosphoesterase family protein